MVLFAATELDVFTQLHGDGRTASELASACGVAPEPLRLLLEACAAEGMVTRTGDRYHNTPVTDAFLVRGWNVRHIMDNGCHAHRLPPFARPEGERIIYGGLL